MLHIWYIAAERHIAAHMEVVRYRFSGLRMIQSSYFRDVILLSRNVHTELFSVGNLMWYALPVDESNANIWLQTCLDRHLSHAVFAKWLVVLPINVASQSRIN